MIETNWLQQKVNQYNFRLHTFLKALKRIKVPATALTILIIIISNFFYIFLPIKQLNELLN